MPSTRKKFGRRKFAAVIRTHRDALERHLCNPRPDGLPSYLRWGISWEFESGANGAIAGAILTVWCVKPEHIAPRGERPHPTRNYGANSLTAAAWGALMATCETIAQELGWARGTVRPNYGADVDTLDTPAAIEREREVERAIRTAEKMDRIKRGLDPDNAAPMFE